MMTVARLRATTRPAPSTPPFEAIAKGQDRLLLVMATGTGKTYTAFQIIWRLWKAGHRKRILFLADRNVLVDQTMVNDFRPFSSVMTKLSSKANTIQRDDGGALRIDTAYEVYLGLYQALTGLEENQKVYREVSPGFFDLIVVDECHRGSVAEDSVWREILEYFSSATQIGLTATPKETKYASNIAWFGEPVFSYSLKQGIRDGFLAPYKAVKVHIDRDVEGYRPERGQLDRDGDLVEDRIYNTRDFDRTLVIDGRTSLVAQKVWFWEYLVPEGQKAYSMTRPIQLEHLDDCVAWWGGQERKGRIEGGRAWKVGADEIEASGYNLDIRNPHTVTDDLDDPETLLAELDAAEAKVVSVCGQLKGMLAEAPLR